MHRYVFLNHTADIGISVSALNLEELFVSSAHGLAEIMFTISKKINLKQTKTIIINEDDLNALLVSWLSEFIYIFETEKLCLFKIKNIEIKNTTLKAEVEFIDANLVELKKEVKAVTYHQLNVQNQNNSWNTKIFFDV